MRDERYLLSGIRRYSGLSRSAERQLNPILRRREASIGEWAATSPSLQTKVRSVKEDASRNCHNVCDRYVAWSIFHPYSETNVESSRFCYVDKFRLGQTVSERDESSPEIGRK